MELYYNDNLNSYLREIGGTSLKIRMLRKAKKAFWYYFSDKFSLTINLVMLVYAFI